MEKEFSLSFDTKMPNKYTTAHDLSSRLNGTVVRFDGIPYYCQVSSADKIKLYDLMTFSVSPAVHSIHPSDSRLDISSPEVGYCTIRVMSQGIERDMVVYVMRAPNKQWKQGFSMDTVSLLDIEGKPVYDLGNGAFLSSPGFFSSLVGDFPEVHQALGMLDDGVGETCISQDVALRRLDVGVTLVYYRTKNVGYIVPGSKVVRLPDDSLAWVVQRYLKRFNWVIKEGIQE